MPSLGRVVDELRADKVRASFDVAKLCGRNEKQLRFVQSRARRLVARCSRRSGKTTGVDYRMLDISREPPFAPQLYVTLTRLNAKQIVWSELLRLNHDHQLGGEPNHSELILRMPQGADIVLAGANNEREIAKIRGKRFKGATIDEGQSVPPRIMVPLVNDVIGPTLLDYQGYLAITGTPGPVLAGYFYEADQGTTSGRYERHSWTLEDNVYLPARMAGKSVAEILAEVRAEHRWTLDNPTFRREYLGEWVRDDDALVLHYDAARNACDWQDKPLPGWRYVLAFDIGFDDADAIAVLGYPPHDARLRLVKERVVAKQGISELAGQLREEVETFRPGKVVGDLGGLGKKIAEEIRRRWAINVEAADKNRKVEHVALLDDALRTGAFLAPPDSRFAEDCAVVQWDVDQRARGVLKIATLPHSDIADAVLYGYRAAYHWTERPKPVEPTPEQRMDAHEAKEAAAVERRKSREWWDDGGGDGGVFG